MWTTAAIVSVAIIGLIGTIISVNVKRPKIKDTDKIKKEIEIVNGKIGEVNNCSLIGQHYNIIEILNKNLESDQSNILKNLNNINNYVKNEEFKKEFLGKNYDYLKLLENERFNDKKIIQKFKRNGVIFSDPEREVIKMNQIIKEKDKEIKDLEQKIQYLNKNKGKGYER